MAEPILTIHSVRARAVDVPMALPLGTSAQTIRSAPLLLIDLETEEGVVGRSYIFCYLAKAAAPIAHMLEDAVASVTGDRIDPETLSAKLAKRYRLIGVQGIVRMALSGLDMACWDALSGAAGLPLAAYLGAVPQRIPAYNSNGLGLMPADAAAEQAVQLLDGGFRGVKLRLGRETAAADLAAVRAVRNALPDDIALMADFNQALALGEAIDRIRILDGEGLYWVEEPIRHDDYAGCAAIAEAVSIPIQIGENFSGPDAMATALAAKACDYVMPDLERIGGFTGWRRAAALAERARIPMSSHLFPEVSIHALAATPTRHWLEYVDWAVPILSDPLRIENGMAVPSSRPGAGLNWNEEAVARFASN